MNRLQSWLYLTFFFSLCITTTLAQTQISVEVVRNVNLRSEPTTANEPIELIGASEKLQLIGPEKRRGYYHVRDADGHEGWVWARNVRLIAADETISGNLPETVPAVPPGPAPPMAPGVARHISRDWRKFVPKRSTFRGTEGTCVAEGDGKDAEQYILKNRSDVPPGYYDVTFDAIDELPFPGKGEHAQAPSRRRLWKAEHFTVTNPYETIPVRVEGYLFKVGDQRKPPGKGEGTNCKFGTLGNIDAHIALVKNPNDPESIALVVEWTPRFTQIHPNWTKKKLLPWTKTGRKVRISGWLMVDPNHMDHMGKYRNSLWEIHPITEIEVEVNGRFVDLDTLP